MTQSLLLFTDRRKIIEEVLLKTPIQKRHFLQRYQLALVTPQYVTYLPMKQTLKIKIVDVRILSEVKVILIEG